MRRCHRTLVSVLAWTAISIAGVSAATVPAASQPTRAHTASSAPSCSCYNQY